MQVIPVHTGRSYEVLVGTRLLEQVGESARRHVEGERAVIVTDTNVGPLYADIVKGSLEGAGFAVDVFTFEAGEASKRADTLVAALEFMAERELSRDDVAIALGGGVVGDLGGLAAATYLRGIAYIQVPTSLLAMVDSSVGGKTAIDLTAGKNLAGAFWQPVEVLADVGCLATLEPAQFADGCGEVVKHALLADPQLFELLEHLPLTMDLLMRNVPAVETIVARNVEIKRDVVDADEREAGARKLLNLGHSIGHAVETLEEYRLGHGNCVAIGLAAIARAAVAAGACEPELPDRLEALLRAHGLTTSCTWTSEEVYAAALHDKKRSGDTIDLVIPHAVGDCGINRTPLETFKRLIAAGLEEDE